MKVVLDTNVLVSAFLRPSSNPARILRLILQGSIEIVVSAHILAEYAEVLARPKFDLDQDRVNTILDLLASRGARAPALAKKFHLPDNEDVPFLEAALAGGADALITGNRKHFPKLSCHGQVVLTPNEFLTEFIE